MNSRTKGFFIGGQCAVYLVAVLFFFLTPAFAQSQACTVTNQGDGCDIQNHLTTVLEQTSTLDNNMSALCPDGSVCAESDAGKAFRNKVAQMKAAHQRATNANQRASAADFNGMNRRKSKNKNDGCDPSVQICVADTSSQPMVSASPNNNTSEIDYGTGQDTVANLDEVSTDLTTLNTALGNNVPPPPPASMDPKTDADYFFPPSMWPSETVVYATFLANQVAEKADELAKPACDETLVALGEGGNTALACLVFTGIYQELNYTYETMEFIANSNAHAEIKGAYERTGEIYDNLSSTSNQTQYIADQVQTIEENQAIIVANQAAIVKNQQYVMHLLTLPQGRRPGFPASATPANTHVTVSPAPPGH